MHIAAAQAASKPGQAPGFYFCDLRNASSAAMPKGKVLKSIRCFEIAS